MPRRCTLTGRVERKRNREAARLRRAKQRRANYIKNVAKPFSNRVPLEMAIIETKHEQLKLPYDGIQNDPFVNTMNVELKSEPDTTESFENSTMQNCVGKTNCDYSCIRNLCDREVIVGNEVAKKEPTCSDLNETETQGSQYLEQTSIWENQNQEEM